MGRTELNLGKGSDVKNHALLWEINLFAVEIYELNWKGGTLKLLFEFGKKEMN